MLSAHVFDPPCLSMHNNAPVEHCVAEAIILFISVGEDPRFFKRWVNQYPARLSGGLQSPTKINAPRGCAGIRFGIMSASADPNPAPSLASET